MNEIYTKIDMTNPGSGIGTVVNAQVINPSDPLDPNFTWVDVTNMVPQPGVTWTYTLSTQTFTPPLGD
jgi:hypothetical protein